MGMGRQAMSQDVFKCVYSGTPENISYCTTFSTSNCGVATSITDGGINLVQCTAAIFNRTWSLPRPYGRRCGSARVPRQRWQLHADHASADRLLALYTPGSMRRVSPVVSVAHHPPFRQSRLSDRQQEYGSCEIFTASFC